jgi:hypothetical protein
MKTSEQTDIIAKALAAAQSELQNPIKDATNPHFKARYATLDTGLNVVRPALSKHSIAVLQGTRMEGDVMMLDTRLSCGNQWVESEYPIIRFPAKAQEIGSALTYARRYSLFALVGIAGEDDDDANAATEKTPAPPRREWRPTTSATMLVEALDMAKTPHDLEEWGKSHAKIIQTEDEENRAYIRSAFARKKAQLTQPIAAE